MQNKPKRRPAPSQRRRQRRQQLGYIKIGLVALAAIALVWWLRVQSDLRFGADVFYAGTYVNGLALEGMTYEEAEKELSDMSSSVLQGTSLRLYYGDREWYISTTDLGARLDFKENLDLAWSYAREGSSSQRRAQIRALRSNPIVLSSELVYDQSALEGFVAQIKQEIDVPAMSAQVTVMGFEQLTVSQSQAGLTLDGDALTEQLIGAMTVGGNYEIELKPVVTEPEYTTQELVDATQCLSRLATPTTESSSARTSNVQLALSNFNGMCVLPGQQISFNDVVGVRSPENGYNGAMEYAGTNDTEGYGGGVCQASSTLYVNLVYAGLEINERHCHTMVVGYTKPSLDAAVSDGVKGTAKDLVFTNNTAYPIYIFTSVDRERAYVSIFGKKSDYEIKVESEVLERGIKAKKVDYVQDKEAKYVYYTDEQMLKEEGRDGMRSQAWRYFVKDGEVVTQERLSIDYYQAQADEYWIGVHKRSNG